MIFTIRFWNCSVSEVFFLFHFIRQYGIFFSFYPIVWYFFSFYPTVWYILSDSVVFLGFHFISNGIQEVEQVSPSGFMFHILGWQI
jgi:hypothetical protein